MYFASSKQKLDDVFQEDEGFHLSFHRQILLWSDHRVDQPILYTNLLSLLLIFTTIEFLELLGLTFLCFVAQTPPSFIHLESTHQEVSSDPLLITRFLKFRLAIHPPRQTFSPEAPTSDPHSFSYRLNFDYQRQGARQSHFSFRFFSLVCQAIVILCTFSQAICYIVPL